MVRAFYFAAAFIIAIGRSALAADANFDLCKSNSQAQDAIAACGRVIQSGKVKGDDLASIYYNRGLKQNYNNKYDQAISDLTQAIKLKPKNVWAHVARGHAYAYKKQFALAFADQETAIGMEATEVTYTGRAMDLIEAGAYDRAIADLNEALRINAKYFYGYLRRGDAYLKKREYGKAEADYRMALEIKPTDKNAKDGIKNAQNHKAD